MQHRLRKRISENALNLATFLLVFLNLVPIFWMVYSSFKDNNEILNGKVLPGRRPNEVIFLSQHGDDFLAGTSDGGVTLLNPADLSRLRHIQLGTFATRFLRDGENLWVLSSNRGLLELDWKTLKVQHTYSIGRMADAYGPGWKTLWVNDVPKSMLARSGDRLYFAFRNARFPGLAALDLGTRSLSFIPEATTQALGMFRDIKALPSGDLALSADRGLFLWNGKTGIRAACARCEGWPQDFDNLATADSLLVLAQSGSIYLYSPARDTMVGVVDSLAGAPLPTAFSVLHWDNHRLWAGHAQGALHFSISGDSATSPWVSTPQQSPGYQGNGDVSGMEVTAMLPVSGDFLFGGRGGALSLQHRGSLIHAWTPPAPWYFHWRNYIDLWRNIDFGLYLKNSLIVSGTVMLLAVIFASMGGYALARYEFPGKNAFSISVLATQMVPGILLLLPIYLMFVKIGQATGIPLKGSYFGLIFTYTAYFVPFSIWILRGFFASLPKELEEAALLDGCGPLRAFFTIIVPSAWPGIIATGITVFLSCWDELMFAWVLTDERTFTLPVGIRLFVGNFQNRFDLMMAAATVSTLPPMILFFLMQKHIVAGLTAGAVKD